MVASEAAAGCERRGGGRIDYSRPSLNAKSQSYSGDLCGFVGGQECPRLEKGHTESSIMALQNSMRSPAAVTCSRLNPLLRRNVYCETREDKRL